MSSFPPTPLSLPIIHFNLKLVLRVSPTSSIRADSNTSHLKVRSPANYHNIRQQEVCTLLSKCDILYFRQSHNLAGSPTFERPCSSGKSFPCTIWSFSLRYWNSECTRQKMTASNECVHSSRTSFISTALHHLIPASVLGRTLNGNANVCFSDIPVRDGVTVDGVGCWPEVACSEFYSASQNGRGYIQTPLERQRADHPPKTERKMSFNIVMGLVMAVLGMMAITATFLRLCRDRCMRRVSSPLNAIYLHNGALSPSSTRKLWTTYSRRYRRDHTATAPGHCNPTLIRNAYAQHPNFLQDIVRSAMEHCLCPRS